MGEGEGGEMENALKYDWINYKKWEIAQGRIMGSSTRRATFRSTSR